MKMSEPASQMISVKAIEDIIQIQKLLEEPPNDKSNELDKNKSNERVVYSVLKHDVYSPEAANNRLSCILKECEVENSFKCNEKTCKRLEVNCWEGVCGFPNYVNPEVVLLENIENLGLIEGSGSEPEVKSWSSDSDVTVLRFKKEFRNELSNKVEWEEQRNLADDASISSTNLDWESHSLINLAGIIGKEKDVQETLTPFTIWTKTNQRTNSSMVLVEKLNSFQPSDPCSPEIKLTAEDNSKDSKKFVPKKKKVFSNIFKSIFSCIHKKKSF